LRLMSSVLNLNLKRLRDQLCEEFITFFFTYKTFDYLIFQICPDNNVLFLTT
jgi:hypothetical protein